MDESIQVLLSKALTYYRDHVGADAELVIAARAWLAAPPAPAQWRPVADGTIPYENGCDLQVRNHGSVLTVTGVWYPIDIHLPDNRRLCEFVPAPERTEMPPKLEGLPTEAGQYWYRGPYTDAPGATISGIVTIDEDEDGHGLYANVFDLWRKLTNMTGEWYGPLAPPWEGAQ